MFTFYEYDKKEKWNEIVKSFHNYDVFYLYEYVEAFMKENCSYGKPVLILYENGKERAINVVFKRDISEDLHFLGKLEKGKFYDLCSPYGYGGFLGNVSDYELLLSEYTDFCQNNGFISEFVRFNLFSDYCKFFGGEVVPITHNIVRSLDGPIEDIWMDFKPKVRKNVKKAQKMGVVVKAESSGLLFSDFKRIYDGTMKRNNASEGFYFSNTFFETLNQMKENIMYFHAEYEGKIISTELVLYSNENAYSFLGGTDSDYYELRPNDLIKYEIIKWAKENGLNNFVLGGGYGEDDGIYKYKESFAPNGVCDFYIGRAIYNIGLYEDLVKMREPDLKKESGFFPLYRA